MFAGANYQVLIAAEEILGCLAIALWRPQEAELISLEPRAQPGEEQVGFDLGKPKEQIQVEVKLNPTREDVRQWLRSLARLSPSDAKTLRFVAGSPSRQLEDLTRLCQVAREATNENEFTRLLSAASESQQQLATELGAHSWHIAQQIETRCWHPDEVEARVTQAARNLAGPTGGAALVDHVRAIVTQAAARREVINVGSTLNLLRSRGIHLNAPAVTEQAGMPLEVFRALLIVQHCDHPIPLAVVAEVIGTAPDVLLPKLTDVMVPDLLGQSPPQLATRGNPQLHSAEEDDLVASTLSAMLVFVTDHAQRSESVVHLQTIYKLATVLQSRNRAPAVVSRVFPIVDKIAKASGDLHLVLGLANVSYDASYRPPPGATAPTNQMLMDRTQTLVCGQSWVHQRTGNLARAAEEAERSLELGRSLDWSRNTAFCLKCLGRLRRVQAERETDPLEKNRNLAESWDLLVEAVEAFRALEGFGPGCEDEGECLSLLARTALVAGNPDRVTDTLPRALDILRAHHGSKAWADALILEAEVLAGRSDRDAALDRLSDVLAQFADGVDGIDATEIAARAFAARGRLRGRQAPVLAVADLEAAARLYSKLDDPDRKAQLTVESWDFGNPIPIELAGVLRDEPPRVKVVARAMYDQAMAASLARSTSQRAGASKDWLRKLIRDARLEAAREQRRW